jgi:hypothetical protein
MNVLFVSNPCPQRTSGGNSGSSGVRATVSSPGERYYAPRNKSARFQAVNSGVDQSDTVNAMRHQRNHRRPDAA